MRLGKALLGGRSHRRLSDHEVYMPPLHGRAPNGAWCEAVEGPRSVTVSFDTVCMQ